MNLPDNPAGQTYQPINVRKLMPWIAYLIFFAVLNETVFNVSVPKIAQEFGLSSAGVSWMMTIFMVLMGIGSIIFGKLSDIFSLRSLIILGVFIYAAGSLLGFLVQSNYGLVIVARAIQGIGASAIPALIFVVVARHVAIDRRGRVFGLITATVSLGVGFGPIIGGFVTGHWHWAYLFLLPVVTIIAVPFFAKMLPAEKRRAGQLDLLGAVLVSLAVGTLIVYLNFTDWYYLLAFALLLGLFIVRIRTAAAPFMEPKLFKNAKFRSGVIVGFILFSVVLGVLFLIPIMLTELFTLSPEQIGLLLFPGAISSVIFGPISGTLADKRGNNFVVTVGLAFLLASMVVLSFWLTQSIWVVCVAMLLNYIGFAWTETALVNSVSQVLDEQETGVGMGIFNLITILSGAVGMAVVGKLLDSNLIQFTLIPMIQGARGSLYSNLMILFGILIVVGGVLYLRSYRKRQPS